MEKSAVVRKRRSYPHGCAIDPEVVNNDFIEDNVGSSDSDRTIESDMFVTMVSTCACMCEWIMFIGMCSLYVYVYPLLFTTFHAPPQL